MRRLARSKAGCHVARGKVFANATKATAAAAVTSEQALQQAQEQGLTLRKADNKSGYANVSVNHGGLKPFAAQVRRGGKTVYNC